MDRIVLINFRCFQHLELSFKKRLNVFIGDNASGKTTIIKAIRSVLSSFFTGYSDANTKFIGLSKSDFTIRQSTNGAVNELPITIEFHLLGCISQLVLNTEKTKTLKTPLYPIKDYGHALKETLFDQARIQKKSLPLFASFSTEDIHRSRSLSIEIFKQYSHKPSFGYYECLQGGGLLSYWTKRLLVLKEGGKSEVELDCVQKSIRKALGPEGCNIISSMEIRPNQGKVYYHFIDGREVDSENLSDGYTRLVNIVTDLSFRCALLNQGIFGDEACDTTIGTVLIDEIDLHLHPSLQTLVLKGLQYAFPNLQFIVTTHAPMVMTNIKTDEENVVYKLSYSRETGYETRVIELYGMDASSIINVVLSTIPRSQEVDEELNLLFRLIDDDKYDLATQLLNEMKNRFGDSLPELIKAESMLNFLNVGDD